MGMFDASIKEKIKIKTSKQEFLEFFKNRLTKEKEYETTLQGNSLEVSKCHLDTLLKYNTKIDIQKSQGETELVINAELHDTLILTLLIILAILLTYGIGVIFVAGYAYLQKKKAKLFLEKLIKDYETIT
jgi:hypothetical protein